MPESRTSISSPENFPCVLSTCTITPFGACAGRYFLAVIPILQPALRPASSTRVRKAVARVMVIASIHRNAILHKARLEGFARGAPLPQRAEFIISSLTYKTSALGLPVDIGQALRCVTAQNGDRGR